MADAVAQAADRSFLVARITAGTLAAAPALPDLRNPDWHRSLPRVAADAMRQDLRQRFGEGAERVALDETGLLICSFGPDVGVFRRS